MLVTMTPPFWQQTQNYISWKLGENVAISSHIGMAKSRIFDEIFTNLHFFEERKVAFLAATSFRASLSCEIWYMCIKCYGNVL